MEQDKKFMPIRLSLYNKWDIWGAITIFCYIFSFYIVGPITSSMIVAIPYVYIYYMQANCHLKLGMFCIRMFCLLGLILFVGLFYCIVHTTFDYSYVKTMSAQFFHLAMGAFIATVLRIRFKVTAEDIEKYIVIAFLVQSIIELVASVTPSFASMLLPFNRAYEFAVDEAGRRGLALASGTGWSLGLAFGLLYIIYVKRYLLSGINIFKIGIGVILLGGTMFAGRTGFVGAALGILLFFLNANKGIRYKLLVVINILLIVAFTCVLFYICFPALTIHLVENVFPFAFEPFYKLFYNGEFSTSSTDRLQEMWEVSITPWEVLLGTGNFTEASGSYYKHIDIGIMRNLFYWGIVGYVIMIIYQLYFLYPIRIVSTDKKQKRNVAMYRLCLVAYLFLMEFKAMVIGFNKMSMSIVFLLGFFYYYEYREKRSADSIRHYSLL